MERSISSPSASAQPSRILVYFVAALLCIVAMHYLHPATNASTAAAAPAAVAHPASTNSNGEFGVLTFLARPMFQALTWTERNVVHNWGWAIILLTVAINLALLPLRARSMTSMRKIQELAPQLRHIQDEYAHLSIADPKRAEANRRIAELYEKNGVQPLAGCLPMLLPLPFLLAFNSLLQHAAPLHGAAFLWLTNLAAPDHTHLLPLLIIAAMLLQQRLMPATGVPEAQQRMMNWMMPLVAGATAWAVASGNGLYWLVSTLLGVAQQWAMNRRTPAI